MLSSLQNPLVKTLRKLQKTKERHKQNCFLIEGTHLIEEAMSVEWPMTVVCCTQSWYDQNRQLWHDVEAKVPRCELVTDDVLRAIATTVNPDGVVAIAPRRPTAPLPQSVAHYPHIPTVQLGIALETIQDPGNLGTIIRSATAGHVDGLWLSADSVDLDHPKVLRASAGHWFRLPMITSYSLIDDLKQAQALGVQIVATLPDTSLSYWDIDLTVPTIVLAGNEGAGLSSPLRALADLKVRIPTAHTVESLNVAISVSLLIFESNRQRNIKDFSAKEAK